MAADSDGGGPLIETVVTCEGDISDPQFPHKFKKIVKQLRRLLCNGNYFPLAALLQIRTYNGFLYHCWYNIDVLPSEHSIAIVLMVL